MDQSSRLDFILQGSRVPVREVTPEEWVAIVNKLCLICKPVLNLFGYFREVKQHLRPERSGYNSRSTPKEVLVLPEGYTEETRLLLLADVYHNSSGTFVRDVGLPIVEERALLLSQDGSWVRWTARYHRSAVHNQGFTGRHTGVCEVATESKFEIVAIDSPEFLEVMSGDKGPEIAKSLHLNLARSVQERRKWLTSLERREADASEILMRVDFNSHLF